MGTFACGFSTVVQKGLLSKSFKSGINTFLILNRY